MDVDAKRDDTQPTTCYSIGHSNHSLETFLGLLERHEIKSLVDVRSAPYSRYVTHFNRAELEYAIERRGIRYVYLGDELGGRPSGNQYYDDKGYVLYFKMAQAEFFHRGLDKLIEEGALYRTAMMCSEEDPANCHRRLLIARVLEERGIPVLHIRANDKVQTENDLKQLALPKQLTFSELLSGTEQEESEWKSIRPVLHERLPSSSSNPSDDSESDNW